ncbi:MAG: DNA starvation/stationary phase protection protein [Veillonellaceae bacterium]|nr:DNA starvation/stationary phase protection protein [Veillonellaceae bacterium]
MKGEPMRNNRNDDHGPKQPMLVQPNIGLDSEVRHAVVALLNIILADEVVLITKTRCAHWNILGADFYGLRSLYKIQYQDMINISDAIAERVRMLGGFAIGSMEEFLRATRLEEQPEIVPDVLHLLANYETSIRFLREDVRKCGEEYEDAGTLDLLVDLMRLHEKTAWVLRAYIKNEKQPHTF